MKTFCFIAGYLFAITTMVYIELDKERMFNYE